MALLVVLFVSMAAEPGLAVPDGRATPSPRAVFWDRLIAQAGRLGLPTRFLSLIDPEFVTIEFADLRSFAAEYHPAHHRMVLNRALSFNEAGSTLRPLSHLTHRDLATLYHELFHAYMDFSSSGSGPAATDPDAQRLRLFARRQQPCRYQHVLITPVVQQKSLTEKRFLTGGESWEALNETWAVFVGWAIWTRLELRLGRQRGEDPEDDPAGEWLERLGHADRQGLLVGFYEPENPQERALTSKRYLAPSHRISPAEVALLLEVVLEETTQLARRSALAMARRPHQGRGTLASCEGGAGPGREE